MSALTSEDGLFSITPDNAVDVAYMISCAEGHFMSNPGEMPSILELIEGYLRGDMSCEEVRKELKDTFE